MSTSDPEFFPSTESAQPSSSSSSLQPPLPPPLQQSSPPLQQSSPPLQQSSPPLQPPAPDSTYSLFSYPLTLFPSITPATYTAASTTTTATTTTRVVSPPLPPSVVTQYLYETLPYLPGRQPLRLYHCVQKVFVAPFYGDFSLYDKSGRLLGTSSQQTLSFLKKDLQTECARVWYDAYALQGEAATLLSDFHVEDPGLFFGFGEVTLAFEQAPPLATDQVYPHIPVFFHVTNVWNNTQKKLLFQ